MHTIFAPGFPGLLEAIYVQERVMERKMPAVWTSFVSAARNRWRLFANHSTEKELDCNHVLRHQVVHYIIQ